MSDPEINDIEADEHPPIFQTWKQMYVFVLVLHAFIIFLFYVLTRTYA